jgi:hypothetical protein
MSKRSHKKTYHDIHNTPKHKNVKNSLSKFTPEKITLIKKTIKNIKNNVKQEYIY